jgi:hypothetical protein
MNPFRQHPWIGFVVLFSLPVLAWTVFFILARQHPAIPLPKEPAPPPPMTHDAPSNGQSLKASPSPLPSLLGLSRHSPANRGTTAEEPAPPKAFKVERDLRALLPFVINPSDLV